GDVAGQRRVEGVVLRPPPFGRSFMGKQMITTGFWCDECRRKYVRHLCHGRGLPCRHSYAAAPPVWCQAFGRGGENVCIGFEDQPGHEDVWLFDARERDTCYCSSEARLYWGTIVESTWRLHGVESAANYYVGEWLACKS